MKKEGSWIWTNSGKHLNQFSYSNWRMGQPDDYGTHGEDCAMKSYGEEVEWFQNSWTDFNCGATTAGHGYGIHALCKKH